MLGRIFNKVISLRVLIPLLILLVVLLLMGFVFDMDVKRESEFVYDEYQRRQMDTAVALQASIERDVRVGLAERLQQSFSELSIVPEVRVALLADEQDQVIASTRMSLIGTSLMQAAQQLSAQDWLKAPPAEDNEEMTIKQTVYRERNAILVAAPVRMDVPGIALARNKIGRLFIYTDVTVPLAGRYLHVKKETQRLLVGFISLALLIGLLLHWTVTRRVVKLLHAAELVGEGNLNEFAAVGGADEIGRLGAAFDGMVQKMARSSTQIRKLSRAVEQSPNTIIIADSEGIIEYVNPHFSQISGYTSEEVIGKSMRMHQSGMTPAEMYEDLWRTGQVWRGELLNKSKQGKLYWEELSISPIFDEQGNITHFLSQQIDITARKQVEEQIRLFEKVFANANEAILISDANNCIVATNPAFTEITGYTAEEVIGKTPHILASGQMDAEFYKSMWSSIKATGKWQGEVVDRRKGGEIYAEWLSISALLDDSGRLTHYVALMSDISERKAAEEHMTYLAQHDVLTGLPNRMLFQDRLRQAITYAERQQTSVALLFMDLDRFKDVNDTLGHHVGDLLLQEVTRRIRLCVRGSDTVSRQGGDEYVIMLPNLDDLGDIMQVVNKLIESIANPYELEGHAVHVTTSLGVSVYPQDGADIETLIKNADTAMYQAKYAGRNGYRFFTQEMNYTIAKRVGLENKLRRALNKNELLLHYQPQVDLRSGQIVAAEALVRWQHPEDGLTSPAEFIRIAEESGMIVSLGEWVLNEACRQNQEWRAMGLREISMSVNLSPFQLHDRSLMEIILAALARSSMPSNALELEITESAMMRSPEQAITVLNKIIESDIRVSIDDFGTGYSSLSHLKKFPIYELKVDQSFVRNLSTDKDDAAIVSAVIGMAKSLGLSVTAEGVETIEQLRFLKKLDCDKMQGFYFSKPLTADEFRKLLESGRKLAAL
jgi:diguanylate cyclase (GGDEF)-like protein/PAS domain S-box-containing protein